jgi:hypothetical protein
MICPPSFSDDEKRHFDTSDYIAGRCGDAGGVPLEGESWFFDFARNDKSFFVGRTDCYFITGFTGMKGCHPE